MIGLLMVVGEVVRGTTWKSSPSRDAMTHARDGRSPRKSGELRTGDHSATRRQIVKSLNR